MTTAVPPSHSTWPGYGPVPFGGKPPPLPSGWNPNALATWNKGFWGPNPFYNPNAAGGGAQPWMPAQAWQHPQQAGANFNPYKRVVKPPSAEYLASALSDNPLGLTNMIPREQLYGKEDEEAPAQHTPWIWNPTRLEEDDDNEAIITAVYRDKDGHNIGRESRGPAPTRHRDSPVDNGSRPASQTRHLSEPSLSASPNNNARHRYNSEPPLIESSSERRGSLDRSSSSFANGRDRSKDRPRQSSFQYGPSPPNSASSTNSFGSVHRANPIPPQPPPHEEFTGDQPLRPTFSTAIIRIPEHYSNSPRRSNSTSSVSSVSSNTPPRTLQAHGSLDSMTNRLNQLSVGEARRATQLSSSVESAMNGGSTVFVDEPSSMLSPLMMATPKPLASRSLTRQHSAPTSLDSIPETSPIPRPIPPPQLPMPPPQHSVLSSRHVSPLSSRHVSPTANEAHISPPNSASRHRHSDHYSSPPSGPPSGRPSPRRQRRKGFWNRRGDHLTSTGKVVYAPPDRAYPPELHDYPGEEEGYKDEFGIFIGYLDSRPELEESLPRHGRPPARPYDSFVEYDN